VNSSALSRSALGRARADWLFGLNLTRAYTIKGRQAGYQGVLSIGRVQNPSIRSCCCQRQRKRSFLFQKIFIRYGQAYKLIKALSSKQNGCQASLAKPYMDEENRVLSLPLAQMLPIASSNKPALVIDANYKQKKQSATIALQFICTANWCCQSLLPFCSASIGYLPNTVWTPPDDHLSKVRLSFIYQPNNTKTHLRPLRHSLAQAVKYNKARKTPTPRTKAKYGMINKLPLTMRSSQRRKHTKQLHYPKPKPWYLA